MTLVTIPCTTSNWGKGWKKWLVEYTKCGLIYSRFYATKLKHRENKFLLVHCTVHVYTGHLDNDINSSEDLILCNLLALAVFNILSAINICTCIYTHMCKFDCPFLLQKTAKRIRRFLSSPSVNRNIISLNYNLV